MMRWLLVWACLFCSVHSFALDPSLLPSQYLQQRFARDVGLPSDTIWAVRQDASGYLWVGTSNGLARYDGDRFTIYNRQTHPSLLSHDIRAIDFAADGTLWIGTYGGGAAYWDGSDFVVLDTRRGLASDVVYDVSVGPSGAVWFATGAGASRWQAGTMTSWDASDGLPDNRLFRVHETSKGDVWFITLTNGIGLLRAGEFASFAQPDGLDSLQVHLLVEDPTFGVLAGTINGGVYSLQPGGVVPFDLGLPENLPVHHLLRDRDGGLWLATYGRGLWYQPAGGAWQRFNLDMAQQDYIFDLHEDREGGLWVATMHGLLELRDTDFRTFGLSEGLANSTFVVAESPRDKTIWIGTEGDGLFRLGPDGVFQQITEEQGLSYNSVSALHIDDDGTVWAGTFGAGINEIRDGQVVRQWRREDGLTDEHIMGLLRDRQGALWISVDGGLLRMDQRGLVSVAGQGALPDPLMRQLLQSSDGRIWVGSNAGLVVLDGDIVSTFSRADGLPSNMVSTMYEDATGVLWVGSRDGGLARIEDDQVFGFTSSHGLAQQSVQGILEDDRGRLWLSGADGLTVVSLSELNAVARGDRAAVHARLYQELDGLRSAQFRGGYQPSAWRASDGHLWFPSSAGVVKIDPADLQPEVDAQPVIEAVRVNGENYPLAQQITLPAEASALEVEYSAPRLRNAQSLKFYYQLDGVDRDWNAVANRRTAYFTGLPAGEMVFRVAVSGPMGSSDPQLLRQTQIYLYRTPYWHQTWVFRVMLAALIAAFIVGIYRLVARHYALRERRLRTLVAERTVELERALAQVQEVSRLDGLTGVANRRHFDEYAARVWAQAQRQQEPLSIVMVDIDYFKQYNDEVGHLAGDDCLRRVAEALSRGLVRDGDMIARYGGEEFVAILPRSDAAAANSVAERIHRVIKDLAIPHPNSPVGRTITVSVGCATVTPAPGEVLQEVLYRADTALYEAKAGGRNRTVSLS